MKIRRRLKAKFSPSPSPPNSINYPSERVGLLILTANQLEIVSLIFYLTLLTVLAFIMNPRDAR